ncbi:hypothetical protein SAMN05444008_12730 [Cnuella takakiae]|uniref:Uncharacterized protein n=1 Tax=Cnuella takakiae TaxID=1302690 RepID=A0A1M5J3L7_9BACT|nr:hypothetical protein [Cnuella takakiae]OLY91322.1 hypothetical protein BUE76_04975 [Cnuella takakiae]SHG34899.1 hypothetical protein SAMN05444008_12730 [Cnuella takakiae]
MFTDKFIGNKALLYSLLVFAALSFCSCKKLEPNEVLGAKLQRAVTLGSNTHLSLDTAINDFEWDILVIKRPYASRSMEDTLQKYIDNRNQLLLSENDQTEGWNYLIFVSGQKAVAYIRLPEAPCCSFSGNNLDNPVVLKKHEAVFRIGRQMYKSKTHYTLILE